jgi:hypothetical protein
MATMASVGSIAPSAKACGGAWMPFMEDEVQIDHRPQGVAAAERTFQKGKYSDAAAAVIRMMPHARSLKTKSSPVVSRALHLLAVATVRHDGALPLGQRVPAYAQGTWAGKTAEQRAQNLEWAVSTLRDLSAQKQDDPALQTELGEALSKIDARHDEARGMLEQLAKNDLVASPEGYAALATLRQKAGDRAGQQLAMKRCEAMAKSSDVCVAAARAQG